MTKLKNKMSKNNLPAKFYIRSIEIQITNKKDIKCFFQKQSENFKTLKSG